jgi:hypothetical protein
VTDREAPTLPPPSEPFAEPLRVSDTEPPISPALEAALIRIVDAAAQRACERAFAPVAEHWGNTYVALLDHVERVEEMAKNAIELGKERDKAAAERERTNTDRFIEVAAALSRIEAALVTHQRQPMNHAHGSLHDLQDEMERASRGGE